MSYKEQNKYNQLINIRNKALNELREWERQCVTVKLDGSTDIFALRYLHSVLEKEFPELVSDRRISDGGSNKMTLVGIVDEIKAALQLILSEYPKINNVLNNELNTVINSLKTETTIKLYPNYF